MGYFRIYQRPLRSSFLESCLGETQVLSLKFITQSMLHTHVIHTFHKTFHHFPLLLEVYWPKEWAEGGAFLEGVLK